MKLKFRAFETQCFNKYRFVTPFNANRTIQKNMQACSTTRTETGDCTLFAVYLTLLYRVNKSVNTEGECGIVGKQDSATVLYFYF